MGNYFFKKRYYSVILEDEDLRELYRDPLYSCEMLKDPEITNDALEIVDQLKELNEQISKLSHKLQTLTAKTDSQNSETISAMTNALLFHRIDMMKTIKKLYETIEK